MLSLGGALGGVTVGLVAPHVLPAYYELGIGLVLVRAGRRRAAAQPARRAWPSRWRWPALCGWFLAQQVQRRR